MESIEGARTSGLNKKDTHTLDRQGIKKQTKYKEKHTGFISL